MSNQQNNFEGETKLLKRCWKNCMAINNYPKRVLDYSLVYKVQILSIIARGKYGILGLEKVTEYNADTREYLDFGFWNLVWFGNYPEQEPELER